MASVRVGPAVFVLPLLLPVVGLAVWRPQGVLYILLIATVVWEQLPTDPGALPLGARLYEPVFKGMSPVDLLVGLLFVAVGLDAARRRRLIGVGPLTVGAALITVGVAAGMVTGHFAQVGIRELIDDAKALAYVVIIPVAVVNLLRAREAIIRMLVVLTLLTAFKSVAGLALLGAGRAQVAGQPITYYGPAANWLCMAFVLVMLAAALRRIKLPAWAWAVVPLALASLALSYRRSFWIAFVLGAALVVLIGAGRRGRRVIVPALGVLAVAGWLALNVTGGHAGRDSPLLARVQSLNPSRLRATADDRYRIDERRNVLAVLGARPLTGLGLGVPWPNRYPLAVEHANGRGYTHIAVLWYWLKLGPLGLAGYLALAAGALWMAIRVARFHRDRLMGALGLGLIGAVGGLAAAEFSASFTGVDVRLSVVLPVGLGVLAAAYQGLGTEAQRAPDPVG